MNIGDHGFWEAFYQGTRDGLLIAFCAICTFYFVGFIASLLFRDKEEDEDE